MTCFFNCVLTLLSLWPTVLSHCPASVLTSFLALLAVPLLARALSSFATWWFYWFPVSWKTREACFPSVCDRSSTSRRPPTSCRSISSTSRRPSTSCRSTLFSVALADAQVQHSGFSSPLLTNIRIPARCCPPAIQGSFKYARGRPPRRVFRLKSFSWVLAFLSYLLCFGLNPSVTHALPDTNFALQFSEKGNQGRPDIPASLNLGSQAAPPTCLPASNAPPASAEGIRNGPFCFVVDTDSAQFLVDSGANRYIVNDPRLLEGFQATSGHGVKGIGGTPARVAGLGTLPLSLPTDDAVILRVPAVFVPSSPFNIAPPQLMYRDMAKMGLKPTKSTIDDKSIEFSFLAPNNESRSSFSAPCGSRDLFFMETRPGYSSFHAQAVNYDPAWEAYPGFVHTIPNDDDEAATPSVPDYSAPAPINFNEGLQGSSPHIDRDLQALERKKQLLFNFHEKYGHLNFDQLKLMARANLIPRELANVVNPVCPVCAYGKAHRKPWRTKGARNRRKIKPASYPGEVVSVDQLISPTPGFVPIHRGRPTLSRYKGATVFVDHYSDYTYVHLMTDLDGPATVEAKLAFERVMASHGVTVRHYHADNGLFDTKIFRDAISKARQGLTFCGVNAHHQNGRAENRIKVVTQGARTSLIAASHRWPQAIHASLWPAALKHFVNVRNQLPTRFVPEVRRGRKTVASAQFHDSPLSKLNGTEIEPNLRDLHPFGCPIYVLENSLQAHHAHNKWSDRSRVGIFLNHSPHHASSVPLVLNTDTGLVSPQFHCIYDDNFDTCKRDAHFRSLWQHKAKLHENQANDPSRVNTLTTQVLQHPLPSVALPQVPHFVTAWDDQGSTFSPLTPDVDLPNGSEPEVNDASTVQDSATGSTSLPPDSAAPPTVGAKVTRSGRAYLSHLFAFSSLGEDTANDSSLLQNEERSEPHPLALAYSFAAVRADPDTLNYQDAMRAPDRAKFIEAMHKELNDHIQRSHWKIVPRSSVPKHKRAIPMVWSYKRKRDPIGNIIKWKARLCAGGHRSMENVDYWDTYSPVVSWSTVRLMIVFALLHNWHMESIDFVLAYPQAPVKTDIYMQPPRVPPDFVIPDLPKPQSRITQVYKLLQNLYGLKDAGRTWLQYLDKGLRARGWNPSQIDSCLYTKEDIILVVYVDDAILLSPHQHLIEREISSLMKDYKLTDEGKLKDYLGTRFVRGKDGSITLTQPRTIERILDMLGLNPDNDRVKTHDSPADSQRLLDRELDSPPHDASWNYRSVVGCLSYLQAMIRPDITMAVQQCARFCNDPRKPHSDAVKRIGRYLLRTKDKGLVFRPDTSRGLECFVDADWAGAWQSRSSDDSTFAFSRTGYVIMFAGCPIVWASKRQTLIALSTTESEYIALSSALREVIYIMNLLNEVRQRGFKVNTSTPSIKCKVFEDNRSCIEIATNHKTRPRTKHLSIRLHHFRSYVISKQITIHHVSTRDQLADIFTKPLPKVQFKVLRDRFMGWSPLVVRE